MLDVWRCLFSPLGFNNVVFVANSSFYNNRPGGSIKFHQLRYRPRGSPPFDLPPRGPDVRFGKRGKKLPRSHWGVEGFLEVSAAMSWDKCDETEHPPPKPSPKNIESLVFNQKPVADLTVSFKEVLLQEFYQPTFCSNLSSTKLSLSPGHSLHTSVLPKQLNGH